MVCKKCEKKLGKVIVPDKWKTGARNSSSEGGRVSGTNRLLSSAAKTKRFSPYSNKCKSCGSTIHQQGAQWCQNCAYKSGICAMCGVKILDTTSYRQSAV